MPFRLAWLAIFIIPATVCAAGDVTERAVPTAPSKFAAPSIRQAGPLSTVAAGGAAAEAGASAGTPGAYAGAAAGGGAPAGAGASAGNAGAAAGAVAGGKAGAAAGAPAGGAAPGQAAAGSASSARFSLDETVARLQQQVQTLSAQVAALQSVLIISQAGAILRAPTLTLQSLNGTTIQSNLDIAITAGQNIAMQSFAITTIKAKGSALVESSEALDLKGNVVKLNGGTKQLATVGSQVQVPGQPIGQVLTGSQTIFGN